jgi:hypothetical protein
VTRRSPAAAVRIPHPGEREPPRPRPMIRDMSAHPSTPRFEIDERFLHEWFEMGLADMSAYLAKHARFAAYCEQRDGRSPAA